ncbi:hypothetical protein [Nocardioides sp. GY 10127]|uniref:hypothetical protein n=1 Tax=Nocardioides sp. GY 10127 TaxID=2569762 RepID=UPI0010A7F502|nr:hypothetical protein [Nocardioides sp. GY 10127]TIC84408.1 hypothetical protein E8D37_06485 [Nocardioides sp. GY 10127]
MKAATVWKLVGLAGVAGVAAGGAVVARDQRKRAQLSPEQVRDRLHERLARAEETGEAEEATTGEGAAGAAPEDGPVEDAHDGRWSRLPWRSWTWGTPSRWRRSS